MQNKIILPGLDEQKKLLKNEEVLITDSSSILILGAGLHNMALFLKQTFNCNINLVVEDYDNLVTGNFALSNSGIKPKLMDFEYTDFADLNFDLIYSQAAISDSRRNSIVKEIRRILKRDGMFIVGEIVQLDKTVPGFIQEILDNSNIVPLLQDEISDFYQQRNFEVLYHKKLNYTMKGFYKEISKIEPPEDEIEIRTTKRMLKKLKHEANAFINQNADKFIGFSALLLKKND